VKDAVSEWMYSAGAQLLTMVWFVPGGASLGTASQLTGPPLGPMPHERPSGVLKKTT
jgi:hypothetical protein